MAYYPHATTAAGPIVFSPLPTRAGALSLFAATITDKEDVENGKENTMPTHPTSQLKDFHAEEQAVVEVVEEVVAAHLNVLRQAANRCQAKRFINNNNNIQQQQLPPLYRARMSYCKYWQETSNN
jgi:hypothetical protein